MKLQKLRHLSPYHRPTALALIYCGMSLETIEGIISDFEGEGDEIERVKRAASELQLTLARVVIAQHEAKEAVLSRYQ